MENSPNYSSMSLDLLIDFICKEKKAFSYFSEIFLRSLYYTFLIHILKRTYVFGLVSTFKISQT